MSYFPPVSRDRDSLLYPPLSGYSGSNVKTPKRRFWRMLQKSGGEKFVIPDAEGTGTFVNMSCQSNHMKWNASMILDGSIGFLGVSSIICGAIANSAGHHSSLSVLLRGCSGPLCTSSITEKSVIGGRTLSRSQGSANPMYTDDC